MRSRTDQTATTIRRRAAALVLAVALARLAGTPTNTRPVVPSRSPSLRRRQSASPSLPGSSPYGARGADRRRPEVSESRVRRTRHQCPLTARLDGARTGATGSGSARAAGSTLKGRSVRLPGGRAGPRGDAAASPELLNALAHRPEVIAQIGVQEPAMFADATVRDHRAMFSHAGNGPGGWSRASMMEASAPPWGQMSSRRKEHRVSTILITGCSSGFGLLTAIEFARAGDDCTPAFATRTRPVSCVRPPNSTSNSTWWSSTSSIRPVSRRAFRG